MITLDLASQAQMSVIGSMLRDPQRIPLVLSKLAPEDFIDGTCRSTFTAIRKLTREGRPVDAVTVADAMQGGDRYAGWLREVLMVTPTAANVRKTAVRRRMAGSSPRRDGRRHWTANSRIRRLYCHYDSRCGGTNSIEWSHWLVPTVGGDSSGGCPCGSNWKLGRFSR